MNARQRSLARDVALVALGVALAHAARWILSSTHDCNDCRDSPDFHDSKDPDSKDPDLHAHCKQRIHAERAGRIAAERTIREDVVRTISDFRVGFPTLVIGSVRSAFVSKRGTPRQGLLVHGSRGILSFSNEIPADAFAGLSDYSHLFVLFVFHDNTNLPKILLSSAASAAKASSSNRASNNDSDSNDALSNRSSTLATAKFNNKVPLFGAKVFPPLLKGANTGVFATRSPHHPNPFGQSLVKIDFVDAGNRKVYVSGLDMMEGTPIIDIKPWNPADCPVCLHAIVEHNKLVSDPWESTKCASACTQSDRQPPLSSKERPFKRVANPCAGNFETHVPSWVAAGIADPYELPVHFADAALDSLTSLVNAGALQFYDPGEADTLVGVLRAVLSLDIRSFHQGRGKKGKSPQNAVDVAVDTAKRTEGGQEYEVDYDTLNVGFTVKMDEEGEPFVFVTRVVKKSSK
ncbi:hypothetical protein HDU83_000851 [Entophlyctis luteolus]|nr:hypothetical protein HDU83_000851 [Entophlyctis luteolus]